jgi:hypothetical protein
MRSVLSVGVSLAALSCASSALAVEPAPGQAAASAPSSSPIAITATCSLGDRNGVDEAEAKTAADIVCHELAKRGATNTNHEVRFGKLGGRTLVTLASRSGNEYNEVRTFVSGLDEMEVAGPRLAASLTEGKTMEQTRTVDNVMTNEQRAPKQVGGAPMAVLGMYGGSSVGTSSSAAAGFDVGIGYRAGHFGIQADGRAGGIGSGATKIGSASLDIGGRLYLTDGDIAPFVGAGFEVSYFKRNASYDADLGELSGSGAGSFATVGLEVMRAHHIGLVVSGRLDLPFYNLEGERQGKLMPATGPYTYTTRGPSEHVEAYVMPISLNVGLIFH